MQPSSLIFLILIAIWAAYLLQHWVRRREHLATARSVDRFSDAMRVLERRTPLPDVDLSAPSPRSYTVSPARPSRPEVVVKRAQSLRTSAPTRPAATVNDAAVRPTRFFRVLAGVSARILRRHFVPGTGEWEGYLRARRRMDKSAKLAIDRFILVPRTY